MLNALLQEAPNVLAYCGVGFWSGATLMNVSKQETHTQLCLHVVYKRTATFTIG